MVTMSVVIISWWRYSTLYSTSIYDYYNASYSFALQHVATNWRSTGAQSTNIVIISDIVIFQSTIYRMIEIIISCTSSNNSNSYNHQSIYTLLQDCSLHHTISSQNGRGSESQSQFEFKSLFVDTFLILTIFHKVHHLIVEEQLLIGFCSASTSLYLGFLLR